MTGNTANMSDQVTNKQDENVDPDSQSVGTDLSAITASGAKPTTRKAIGLNKGLPPLEPTDRHCNARKKQTEGYCTRPAGWGTKQPGVGRCKLHGGCSPIKTGTHSKVVPKLKSLREHIEAAKNIPAMQILDESLSIQVGLLLHHLERVMDTEGTEGDDGAHIGVADVETIQKCTDLLGKTVERKQRVESSQQSTISIETLLHIIDQITNAINRYVPDLEVRQQIADVLRNLPVPTGFTRPKYIKKQDIEDAEIVSDKE